ncbi:MAG TPA: hypothetical protein VMM15_02290 [Bradyrhizobium sp.]|nr:hypothetical protein [Bradyrhizobium sp.]
MQVHGKSYLAEALRRLSRVPKEREGRIAWDSAKLEHGTFEVLYNLTFDPPIDDYDKDGAIWHALNECARAKDFTPRFFIQKVRAYLEALLGKQSRSFTAVTQINVQVGARLPGKITSVDGALEIRRTLPSSSQKVINGLKDYERSRLNLQDDFFYLVVKVKNLHKVANRGRRRFRLGIP